LVSEGLTWLPAWKLRQLILDRQVTAIEVTRHFLDRIARHDPSLHSYLTVAADAAIEQAKAADRILSRGGQPGPLFGVPVSVKDHFWTRGIRTTAGSLLYQDHVPQDDSVYVERLRAAGAILLGKTNTPELELFYRTKNFLGPECANPWNGSRISGGSSGGAAASVAAGFTPIAVGSDTGGSIRIPAAFCGVFGLVPTSGRVPRHGNFGATLFFSSVGPLSRDVRDAATLLQVLAGPDARDPTAMTTAPPDYLGDIDGGVKGLRIGWWSEWEKNDVLDQRVLTTIRQATSVFTDLGAYLEALPRFTLHDAIRAFWTINDADHYALFPDQVRDEPTAGGRLTPYVAARLARALELKIADYPRALLTRFQFIREMEGVFEKYDLILAPTVGFVAPPLDEQVGGLVPESIVAYTFPANFAGLPAATVPCAFVDGLPVGLQVLGPEDGDALVLRACQAFVQANPSATSRCPQFT
jgi:Asp-tRNA(Asn)/Glu-tRNA(Gln) amidotransferase A subunit family amidase